MDGVNLGAQVVSQLRSCAFPFQPHEAGVLSNLHEIGDPPWVPDSGKERSGSGLLVVRASKR